MKPKLIEEPSPGTKYLRRLRPAHGGMFDVYSVLDGFGVTCPAIAHAAKKLLCPGKRGQKSVLCDLREAREALDRAIELENAREGRAD